MIRADVLRQLRCLRANSFTLEPELTCRLAQYGARIYEVPVSYHGRTYDEGKKIRPIDGLKAICEIVRCRFLDPQFTNHSGFYILSSVAKATGYNRWILQQVNDFMGQTVLEAGSGIGNLSKLLLNREKLVLLDNDPIYHDKLRQRFGKRSNVQIVNADLTNTEDLRNQINEPLETVFCSNVLEHLERDEQVLNSFFEMVLPGGHCIIVVPACRWLYTAMDEELGHYRRYSQEELAAKMQAVGFEIVLTKQTTKLGLLGCLSPVTSSNDDTSAHVK